MNQRKHFFNILSGDKSLMAMFWGMVLTGIMLLGTLIAATLCFLG